MTVEELLHYAETEVKHVIQVVKFAPEDKYDGELILKACDRLASIAALRTRINERAFEMEHRLKGCLMMEKVNHPEYYQSEDGIECIDAIEAMDCGKGFCIGNALKYIWRAGKKDSECTEEDIEKAIWYLNRYLGAIRKECNHADI